MPRRRSRAKYESSATRTRRAAQAVAAWCAISLSIPALPAAASTPPAPDTTPEVHPPASTTASTTGSTVNAQSARLLVELVNVARARNDIPPLLIDPDLSAAARDAEIGRSTHDAARSPAALIASRLETPWTRAGEVSGYGPSVVDFLDATLASPDHRELLMDPSFTRIGLVVDLDDTGAAVHQLVADGYPPARDPLVPAHAD